jgi:hypothetical protein
VAALAAIPATAQVCAPLDDGRVAEPFYEGTVIFWDPVVDYREMVLTISGPCEDIIKVFKKGEEISFDIREITKVTDGTYTWQLRRVSNIDPGVQEKLEGARGTGEEDALWWSFFQKGAIPEGPYVDSASFTVERGLIIDPNQVEEKRATVASRARGTGSALAGLAPGSSDEAAGGNGLATRDQVIPDDLIVQGSACVGFDCVNGESFGFDTIRLKENNLRIQFDDTSVGSFPTGNWQIRANSSSSGGQSFLGFVDQGASGTTETGTLVFAVEAGARANALYVESDGDVGLGTSNPVLDFHISSSNTPGLRLEQTNAGGFTAQTWDIAGNEANFFVRDVTGGSTLPFRIRPGAPTSSIDISADGEVGIGTASPAERLHVLVNTNANVLTTVENNNTGTSAAGVVRAKSDAATVNFQAHGSGRTLSRFGETLGGWGELLHAAGNGLIVGTLGAQPLILGSNNTNVLEITPTGTVLHLGSPVHPDYVFEPDYELESIEEHAAYMWKNKHLPAVGPGRYAEDGRAVYELGESRAGMLEELEKAHIYIDQLNDSLMQKDAVISDLAERLARLESQIEPRQ